jgi:hypothetical protein
MITTPLRLAAMSLLLLASSVFAAANAGQQKPNIVLLYSNTHEEPT